ncbi:competence/damage-inducible protein A [Pseudochrobactrum asaccharolyticum]|uniref:competence/damage-inducible protein A n=1 Tax=Pseudochrobactrum asaccharolyticum TaxID=354351 RepID=UPI0040433E2A
MTNTQPVIIRAAMLAIGDELLSGRTKDKNIGHMADRLYEAGIDLTEVRIVADDQPSIVKAVKELSENYDYLFTSGGIGPTHDDITADAVSAAFDLPCIYDEKAMALLAAHYKARDTEFTPSRQRMARMPQGAQHIDNPVSVAPGFIIGNVYVMAGVPSVFQAMVENILPTLRTGSRYHSRTIFCAFGEGVIGIPLREVQDAHPDTVIGSYPKFEEGKFSTELVVRARDEEKLDAAAAAIEKMLADIQQ